MAKGKSTSAVGAWLVVGCIAALGFALGGKPKTVDVQPVAAAPVATPAPSSKQSFSESLLELAPASRLALARDFASQGLKAPTERREAYALARALLRGFPATDPSARDATGLERELVARQNLPSADKRPVTDSELLAFARKVLPATPKTGPATIKGPPTSEPAPQAYAPPPRYAPPPSYVPANTGGEVEVRGYYRKNGTYVHPHTRRAPRH